MSSHRVKKANHGSIGNHERRLAVLGFHKVGSPPAHARETWFYISATTFDRYLRWLQASNWHVISAQEFLTGLQAPAGLPDRSVLLTFDDGYRSMRDVALPLLGSFGFPAVLFVPTSFIGLVNSFDAGVEPEEPICDWDDLVDLQSHGVSIQSHGVTHRPFSTLSEAERDRELKDSKAVLENRLGGLVELFSYPYGDDGGDRWADAVPLRQAGYKAGCLYGGGPVPVPIADTHKIERVAMGPSTDLAQELEENLDPK